MFKTRLDTFGNDFGHFCTFWKFLTFLKIFEDSTLHGTLGKKFSEKITPKHVQNTFGNFWGTILGFSAILKSFWFFWKFSTTRPSKEHWAKKLFRKNRLKTCSTHVWTLLGTILGTFAISKSFWFFWEFSTTRPSKEHWTKKLFRKNRPKTYSKHVWTLLGTILGLFGILENFWFFWKFSKTRPTKEHWAKNFPKKLPQNMFKTRLDTYGNDFGFVWNFGKLSIFLKIFGDSTLHRLLGKKTFQKITPKHIQNTFGHFWERFWALLQFRKVFWFFWNISTTRPSMEHWAKKIFQKN